VDAGQFESDPGSVVSSPLLGQDVASSEGRSPPGRPHAQADAFSGSPLDAGTSAPSRTSTSSARSTRRIPPRRPDPLGPTVAARVATMVTRLPKRRSAWANSRPTYPPPRTTRCSGTVAEERPRGERPDPPGRGSGHGGVRPQVEEKTCSPAARAYRHHSNWTSRVFGANEPPRAHDQFHRWLGTGPGAWRSGPRPCRVCAAARAPMSIAVEPVTMPNFAA